MLQQCDVFKYLTGGGSFQNPNNRKSGLDVNLATILGSINVEGLNQNKFNKEKLDRIYDFPAKYKEAEIHKIASKYGYKSMKVHNGRAMQDVPICPCCENYPSTVDIPLCYSAIPEPPVDGKEIFLLQTGVTMYFTFIKMVIMYLIIRLLFVDLFTMIKSLDGQYCPMLQTVNSTDRCYTILSGYNLKSSQNQGDLNVLDILNLLFTVVSIVFFLLYRKIAYKLQNWLDCSETSQDDFSILVENIPSFLFEAGAKKKDIRYDHEYVLKNTIQTKIRNWFTQLNIYTNEMEIEDNIDKDFWKSIYSKRRSDIYSDDIVTSITLCYDLTEMENINKLRDDLIQQCLNEDEDSAQRMQSDDMEYIPNQINLINEQYLNLCYKYAMDGSACFNLSHFTGKAFISFQYQHYRDYFLRQYQNDREFLKVNKKAIAISSSNKPNDIYWENMKVSHSERSKNIFYSSVVLFMLLVLSFASLLGIELWRNSQEEYSTGSSLQELILSTLVMASMAVLTNIINYILSYSIQILSKLQKHITKTNRLRSLLIKNIIAQTINTSFIYTILYLIHPKSPLADFGLVSKVTSLIIISGFISVAMQIFIPVQLIYNCINSIRYSPNKPINLFQFQLNQALQQPQFNFTVMYSFYIVFTFVVSFYGILAPATTPILILIFFIQYWVDKYNLFRRFSYPVDMGPQLNRMIIKIFEVSMLMSAVGHFLWDLSIHYDSSGSYKTLNFINLGICCLYISISIWAPHSISKRVFAEQSNFEHHRYSDLLSRNKFSKTYYRQSPATSCLKEAKIAKLKQKANQNEENVHYMHEAPDPVFIREEQFDRYLNLGEGQAVIEKYSQADVELYQNFENTDYDEIAAQIGRNGGLVGLIANPGNINNYPRRY